MARTNVVIMAAGIGSRYGGFKQINPITDNGDIIVDYAVYDALRAGFDKVIFIISRAIEESVREKFAKTIEKRVETEYVFQELTDLPDGFTSPSKRSRPWGTGHAVLAARNAVDAPFAVINADDFYGAHSFEVLHDHLKGAVDTDGVYDFSMVGFVLGNTLTEYGHVARGVSSVTSDGFLTEIVERTMLRKFDDVARYSEDNGETWTDVPMDSIVSMNTWGFTASLMDELATRFPIFLGAHLNEPKAEFLLPSVVNELVQEKRAVVKILPTSSKWFGVTYREDMSEVKKAVQKLIADGAYPETLWED